MISKWQWIMSQISTKLWLRASIFCLVGALAAISNVFVTDILPEWLIYDIGSDSVDDILNILASSMLVVTTFSLSVMVSAYNAASNSATPRSITLLLSDRTAQNALSTFIGTFLFSLVGIIALKMNAYSEDGRFILFLLTAAVVVLVILSLLRWIEHLSHLGRVGHTIDVIEDVATKAIKSYHAEPYLGGMALQNFQPRDTHKPIFHPEIGYVQYTNTPALSRVAEDLNCHIYLHLRTGGFNDSATPIAYIECTEEPDEKTMDRIRGCFSIGGERSFDQDPLYGLIVLSEVASRALSPAINDPGTAIDVIGTQLRILSNMRNNDRDENETPKYPKIHVPALKTKSLLMGAFYPIARDGRSIPEVTVSLQRGLKALSNINPTLFQETAQEVARYAHDQADTVLSLEEDKERIKLILETNDTIKD